MSQGSAEVVVGGRSSGNGRVEEDDSIVDGSGRVTARERGISEKT